MDHLRSQFSILPQPQKNQKDEAPIEQKKDHSEKKTRKKCHGLTQWFSSSILSSRKVVESRERKKEADDGKTEHRKWCKGLKTNNTHDLEMQTLSKRDNNSSSDKSSSPRLLSTDAIGNYAEGKRSPLLSERRSSLFSDELCTFSSCASFDLHTKAFHLLKIEDLVVAHSEKLEDIQFYLSSSNQHSLEVKTFHDPKISDLKLVSDPGIVDDAFLQLQLARELSLDSSRIGGSFVNNYPFEISEAQINCDAYHGEVHPDYTFSILADGCSWGNKSREAAQRSVAAVVKFINQHLSYSSQPINTAKQLACMIIQGLAKAHEFILSGKDHRSEAGTTTINICLQFANVEGQKYLLVGGVGDCKAFIVTTDSENRCQVMDVTATRRLNFDAKDPGGRLGPYTGEEFEEPDLRNLSIFCTPLPKENYIILNMTDGVHDNLNPEQLGKCPFDVDDSLPKSLKWNDLDASKRLELETSYQNKLLSRLMDEAIEAEQRDLDAICEYITEYCHKITAYGRDFMDQNPGKSEPDDKILNPGKMDHCSLMAFRS